MKGPNKLIEPLKIPLFFDIKICYSPFLVKKIKSVDNTLKHDRNYRKLTSRFDKKTGSALKKVCVKFLIN